LIVGWGVEPNSGSKYWIIRNSYGNSWGDMGDFLLRRGENDFGIEADLVSYDPVLCDEGTTDYCKPI
jgi:hypothetical protein